MKTTTKLSILSAAAFAAVGFNACVIWPDDDRPDDDAYVVPPDDAPPTEDVQWAAIDADHTLDTDLGEGAGLFIEYRSGGRWTLWTSCDYNITGNYCAYRADVTASGSPIYDVLQFDTEGDDYVEYYGDNAVTMYAYTDRDSDALEFYTDPGADIEVNVWLDGYPSPEYIVWYGDGLVHNGASAPTLVLTPDIP